MIIIAIIIIIIIDIDIIFIIIIIIIIINIIIIVIFPLLPFQNCTPFHSNASFSGSAPDMHSLMIKCWRFHTRLVASCRKLYNTYDTGISFYLKHYKFQKTVKTFSIRGDVLWATLNNRSKEAIVPKKRSNILTDTIDSHQKQAIKLL